MSAESIGISTACAIVDTGYILCPQTTPGQRPSAIAPSPGERFPALEVGSLSVAMLGSEPVARETTMDRAPTGERRNPLGNMMRETVTDVE